MGRIGDGILSNTGQTIALLDFSGKTFIQIYTDKIKRHTPNNDVLDGFAIYKIPTMILTESVYTLDTTLAHEIGHNLGLRDIDDQSKKTISCGVIMTVQVITWNGIAEEKDIPDPNIKFALPDALIGVFEFPQDNRARNISIKLEIYENNKYIFREAGPDYARNDYGYIIQENGDYYFSTIEGGRIDGRFFFEVRKKEGIETAS